MVFESDVEFRALSLTISTNIKKIADNVGSMQKKVHPHFGPFRDTASNQLQRVQRVTNDLAKETNSQLKELASLPGADIRHHKVLREKLANEFSEVLRTFQSVQREQAERGSESIRRARSSTQRPLNPFAEDEPAGALIELESPGQQPRGHGFGQQVYTQLEDDSDMELLRQKEQAVRQLENDILDVNAIFKDLSSMVHDQGELLDSIEANMENTTINVEQATEQLARARRSQERSRRKKFCLLVFCVVLLGVIVTVISLSFRKG